MGTYIRKWLNIGKIQKNRFPKGYLPTHALLFNTRLPRIKTHKKHETTIYCVAFFLDSQEQFLYTFPRKSKVLSLVKTSGSLDV